MPLLRLLKLERGKAASREASERVRGARSRERSSMGALTPLERQFLPHILEIEETPPSPAYRKLLWTLILLVLVLIAWSCVGKISVVATAPGKFIPDGRIKQIQPLESAIVKAIHVKEGQHVKAGDLLLELDPAISGAALQANSDKYVYNHLEQTRLAAELTHTMPAYPEADPVWVSLQESTRQARDAAYAAKLAEARAQLEEKAHGLASAQAMQQKYRETTEIAEEREASARPLVETGAISRVDYLQLKQDLASNRNDLAAQMKKVEQQRASQTEAQKHLAQVVHDHQAEIYSQLGEKVANAPGLKGDMNKSRELHELKWLRSPVDGWIQKINVTTIGGVVNPAQNLIAIVPEGTPLIVEATLSNDDIGYVREGQTVELKVDTFPFQKYGTLKGMLVWVSPDAEEKSAVASGEDNGRSGTAEREIQNVKSVKDGYIYKVHIRPRENYLISEEKQLHLQVGMTVRADIITDQRRVIDFFLYPITTYLSNGMTAR